MEKPHKGRIRNYYKYEHPNAEGLGYIYMCDWVDHPVFHGSKRHTSWIIKDDGKEIETRNSRYTLDGPPKEQ